MNFRPHGWRDYERYVQAWTLWAAFLVLGIVLVSMLLSCATSTPQPDGTTTADPLSVTLGKRAAQVAIVLSVAKGSVQGWADAGTISQITADRHKANINKVLAALNVAATVSGDGKIVLVKCFVQGNCTDEENMKAAEALGQAFTLLGQLAPLLDKK